MSSPLLTWPEFLLGAALVVLLVVVPLAAYLEHREWMRDSVRPNAKPWDDPRDSIAKFNREHNRKQRT